VKRNFEKVKTPVLTFVEKMKVQVQKKSLAMKRQAEKFKNALKNRLKAAITPVREWIESKALPKVRQITETVSRTVEAQWQKVKVVIQHIYQATISFVAPFANRVQSLWKMGQSRAANYAKQFQRALGKMGKWAEQKSQKFFSFVLKTFGPPIERVISLLYGTLESLWTRLFHIFRRFAIALFDRVVHMLKNSVLKLIAFVKKIPGLVKKKLVHLGILLKKIPLQFWKGLKWLDATLYLLFRRVTFKN
jgi:hypothetical protein